MKTTRITSVLALALAATALSAGSASAAPAPCKPSPFHFTVTKYTGLHVTARGVYRFGIPSTPTYNPYSSKWTTVLTLGRTQATSMTVSASVKVEAKGLVASISAEAGIAATQTATVSASQTYTVIIPSKQWGWVQPAVARANVTGTVTQIDAICNKVLYQGPISVNVPYGMPGLSPSWGPLPPR